MQYFIGSVIALLVFAISLKIIADMYMKESVEQLFKIRYSQKHIHTLIRPLLPPMSEINNINNTPNQSKTDLEKALEWCTDNNYLSLSIFGVSGKSEDHFLGNFFAINEYSDTISCTIYTDYSTITPCIGKTVFNSFKGETVSIVSFEPNNKVTSTNLKYTLDSYKLSPSSRALRNQSLGNNFTIESSEKLMVFQIKS